MPGVLSSGLSSPGGAKGALTEAETASARAWGRRVGGSAAQRLPVGWSPEAGLCQRPPASHGVPQGPGGLGRGWSPRL